MTEHILNRPLPPPRPKPPVRQQPAVTPEQKALLKKVQSERVHRAIQRSTR